MERCVLEVYSTTRPMPNGDWIAEAHMNGTVSTIRMDSRESAVEWANARVRAQARYWEEVRRDAAPAASVYNYRAGVSGVLSYLRGWYCTTNMTECAAIMLSGDNGCLAMFAYEGGLLEHPHSAARDRAREWLRYGK